MPTPRTDHRSDRRRGLKAFALASSALGFGLLVLVVPTARATQGDPEHKVTLCHATAADEMPYVEITVDIASAKFDGHDGHDGPVYALDHPKHEKWGDIIPAFDIDGNVYLGKNVPAGSEILDNHCVVPTSTTSVPPPEQNLVTICHATGADELPYLEIPVDIASVLFEDHDGHDGPIYAVDHPDDEVWGDIIPAFDIDEIVYLGKNVPEGLAILENGCVLPEEHLVTLCHATAADQLPYVEVTVDISSVLFEGHDGHDGPVYAVDHPEHEAWGDIIPAFDIDGNVYLGKNLPDGAAILANHCVIPTTTTSSSTTSSSTTSSSTTSSSTTSTTEAPTTTEGSTTTEAVTTTEESTTTVALNPTIVLGEELFAPDTSLPKTGGDMGMGLVGGVLLAGGLAILAYLRRTAART